MSNSIKKHSIITAVLLIVFVSGIIVGCAGNNLSTSAKGSQHATAVMPEQLKGVHTIPATGSVDVAFSPEGGITAMIVGELSKASKSIQIQAYSFTSADIVKALIDAKKRGVDVRIIIDKSNVTSENADSAKSQKEKELLKSIVDAGILLKVDSDFQIAHSKIMIVDGTDVITGSFNFTYSAEHNNAENCLIFHGNKQLAEQYMKNWQWRWDATENYNS